MKAICHESGCAADGLVIGERSRPEPGPGELLVAVSAAGVNRADVLQRKGFYPPPADASEILGLELSGTVAALGPSVEDWRVGDRIFGLVDGGAYAEYCLLPTEMAIAVPPDWEDTFAAAIPEVFFTADETVFVKGGLEPGERILVHAGGSGVGSTAIQMAASIGARVVTTAGAAFKRKRALDLGAELAIDYRNEDFVGATLEHTGGRGVDLVLDFIGAAYLTRNLEVLSHRGRLVVVGLLGGRRAELDLGLVLRRELRIFGSIMRSRPLPEKIVLRDRFCTRWLPRIREGSIAPVIHATLPLEQAAEAHRMMEENSHFGKITLRIGTPQPRS